MVVSQSANVTVMLLTLAVLIWRAPGWNGVIGAAAQSAGTAAELAVVLITVKRGREELVPAKRNGEAVP